MALQQMIYSDFSGGYNDSMAALSISDRETAKSENADYSAEVKALKTRQGCVKINTASYGYNVTDGYAWTVGSTYKKCLVMNGKIYDVNITTGALTEKGTLTAGATEIYPFVVYDRFYFGDGTKLYVWGDYDKNYDGGNLSVTTGLIYKNNASTNSGSVIGHFYRAKVTASLISSSGINFTDTTNFEDVTDVMYSSSNVVKEVTPYDPSQPEIVLISILKGPTAAGTVSLVLNGVTFTASIAATDTVPQVVDKLYAMTTTGWTKVKIANTVKFTKDTTGLSENGYFDPSTTGLSATYETVQEGKSNDNALDPIKKCTMFKVHTGSYRIFATGNPEDNALFYSEIGKPTYFKSALNKVYPANGYGKVKALTELSEAILVSYENGWYAWNGITPLEDATWKPLNLPYGCACNDSLVLTPYSFTFLGNDGIYTVSASILSSEVVLLQGKDVIRKITENKVDKAIASIQNKSKCKGIFYDNVYYLAYNTDGTNNDTILKFEWDTKSFTLHTGWLVNAWLSDATSLYFASKNFLLKANTGYSDIDIETGLEKAIPINVMLKEYSLGNPFSQKALKFLGLIFKQNNSDLSGVQIIIHMGYETIVIDHKDILEADLAESLIWGRDWGLVWGYRESLIKMMEINRVSNTFQVEIKNSNLNDPVTLIAIGFVYEETDLVLPNITKDEVLLT